MEVGGMIPPKYTDISFPVTIHHSGFANTSQPSCWHEDLEIKLVSHGKTIVIIDSEIIEAHRDEIIFMNPYQIHSMPMLDGNDMIYDIFMIDLDFFQKSGIKSLNLREIFSQNRCRINNHIKNPRLSDILKKLAAANDTENAYSVPLIQGLLLEFFAILLTEEVSDVLADKIDPKHVRYYHAIEPALMAIHTRYNERISGEELAEMCSMSTYYFCRIFKRVMGVTPVQYQTEYRIRIADMLLKYDHQPISEIAHMVGFDDEAYFSRCYKNARGISPRQYKNNLAKK